MNADAGRVARLALITGASSGIGAAFARNLAATGCDLILVGRRAEALSELGGRLRDAHHIDVENLVANLATPTDLDRVEQRLSFGRRPDLLINSAGAALPGRFDAAPVGKLEELVRLQCLAPIRLTHALLPELVRQHHGGIINVCSLEAFYPQPYHATYAAAKAFLLSWTEGLHEEMRTAGVRVVALCPGLTRSEFHHRAGLNVSMLSASLWSQPAEVAAAGLRALQKDRAVHVPGTVNAAAAAAGRLLPGAVVRRVAGRVGKRLIASASHILRGEAHEGPV